MAIRTMPRPYAALTREDIDAIRAAYVAGMAVQRICADHAVSRQTLYIALDGGPPDAQPRLPVISRRREGLRRTPRRVDREALVARLWRTAERQVRDVEERLAAQGQQPADREREARLMAVLVKTLTELAALDAANTKSGTRAAARSSAEPDADDRDQQDTARDIDEFRRELAARIAALAADAAQETGDGTA